MKKVFVSMFALTLCLSVMASNDNPCGEGERAVRSTKDEAHVTVYEQERGSDAQKTDDPVYKTSGGGRAFGVGAEVERTSERNSSTRETESTKSKESYWRCEPEDK